MDDSFSEILMLDFFSEFPLPSPEVKTSEILITNSTSVDTSLSIPFQPGPHPGSQTTTNDTPVASIPQKEVNVQVTLDTAEDPVSRPDVGDPPRAVVSTATSPPETTWSSAVKGRGQHRLGSKSDVPETNEGEAKRQSRKRSRYSGLSEEDAEMKRLKENKQEKERQAMISAGFEDLRREISTTSTKQDSKSKTLRNAIDCLRTLKLNVKTMMGFLKSLIFIINILIQYIIQKQGNSKSSPDDIVISMTPYVTLASIRQTLATISEFCEVSFSDSRPQTPLNSFESKHSYTPNSGSILQMPISTIGTRFQMPISTSGTSFQMPVSTNGTHFQMPVSTSGSHLQMPIPVGGLHFQMPASTSGSSYNQYPVDVNTTVLSPISPESDSSCASTKSVQSIFEPNLPLMSKTVDNGMEYSALILTAEQPTTDINYQIQCNNIGRHFDLKKPTRRILPKPTPQRLILSQSPEGLPSNLTPPNNAQHNFSANSKWYRNGHKHFLNHQPSQHMPYGSNQNSNGTDMDSHAGPDNVTILIPLANIVPQNAATVQYSPVQCAPVPCAPVPCAPAKCAPFQCAPVQGAPVQFAPASRISHPRGSFSKTSPDVKHSKIEEPIYSPVSPYQELDDDNSLILPARTKLLNPFSQ